MSLMPRIRLYTELYAGLPGSARRRLGWMTLRVLLFGVPKAEA